MKKKLSFTISIILITLVCVNSFFAQEIKHAHTREFAFIENKGQWDKNVLFKSQFESGNLWVQQGKMLFHFQDYSNLHDNHFGKKNTKDEMKTDVPQLALHQNFIGANKVQNIEKKKASSHYYNYFMGNDSSKWTYGAHAYEEATLKNYYNNIDLRIIEEKTQLKYEFVVQPNIDPSTIKWDYFGHEGLEISETGNLNVRTKLGVLSEKAPEAYQIIAGKIVVVKCDFILNNNIVSFRMGKYDKSLTLIIDPILIFATYSGSVSDNFGMTATYGYDGSAFSGGTVFGNAYPTPDALAFDVNSNFTTAIGTTYGITDVFISRYAPNGQTMLWTSYIGGGNNNAGTETVHSLICDTSNNIYFFGATSSADFPIQNGYQSTFLGGSMGSATLNFLQNGVYYSNQGTDLYVSKLSANGRSLLGSTYMGGNQNDGVNYKVTSIPSSYSSASWYDSLTTNYGDQFRGEIMLDKSNNVIVGSCTRSKNFPKINQFQDTLVGEQDGVIFKLSTNLSNLLFSSFYGGSKNDGIYSVKVDTNNNIIFAGGTNSCNLLGTLGGYQAASLLGKAEGFIAKINGVNFSLMQSTYLGTSSYDQVMFVEIDRNNNVFALGQSRGAFPVVNASYSNPNSTTFIAKFNTNLTTLLRSTVIGNSVPNQLLSPAAFLVDVCGNSYFSEWGGSVLGNVPATGLPVTSNAFQFNSPNGFDFFVFVLKEDFSGPIYGSYLGGNTAGEHVDGGTSRFDKNGVIYQSVCAGCGGSSDFPTSTNAWSNANLSTNCNNVLFKFDFQIIPKASFTFDDLEGCAPFTPVLTNFSSPGDRYRWEFNGQIFTDYSPTFVFIPGVYTIKLFVTDSICNLTDSLQQTITVYPTPVVNAGVDRLICNGVAVTLTADSFGTAFDYTWSTDPVNYLPQLNADSSITSISVNPLINTTYYVMAKDSHCMVVDTVEVILIDEAIKIKGNDSICIGNETSLNAEILTSYPPSSYDWYPNDLIVSGDGTQNVVVKPTFSQFVYCKVLFPLPGCSALDSIFVGVQQIDPASYSVTATPMLVPEGGVSTLIATPESDSILWVPFENIVTPNAFTTNITINSSTLFLAKFYEGECLVVKTISVQTYPFVCGNPYFFIPSAFTPNGDGNNDVLSIRGLVVKSLLLRIFDRWGELVFESASRDAAWDGTFKGKKLDPDVFDYYLKVFCIDETESIVKGNITLIR